MMTGISAYARRFKREAGVYRRAIADPRCPWPARLLLGTAVAYALSPIDLIPDFIPVVGHLDDLLIVPLLVWLGLRFVPPWLIETYRSADTATQAGLRTAPVPRSTANEPQGDQG